MDQIKRPAFRYHGGKWKIASWVISHFPDHVCYVEPFGGAGSVLLRKPPIKIEVFNDISEDVINFFRILRTRSNELVAMINLTPYSRKEYLLSQVPAENDLERARRFYVWALQGYGRVGTKEPGGWRFMVRDLRGLAPPDDFNRCAHLIDIVERLKNVQLECDDAIKVIRRFDDPGTLFYVDPPYLEYLRGKRWSSAYLYEYTVEEHRQLSMVLARCQGKVVLSGFWSELYVELYQGWKFVVKEKKIYNGRRPGQECLWMNF